MMLKRAFLTFLLCSLTLQAAQELTLKQLIQKALKGSPDLTVSKLNYEASRKRYDQAFGGYLPRLDLFASATHVKSLQTPLIGSAEDDLMGARISLTQLLYDFGRTSATVGSFDKRALAQKASLHEAIVKKQKEVKLAYYEILKNMALIRVNEENLKLNRAQLYRAKRYFEAGIRTKIDISDAKVRVIKAEIALKNSRYDLQRSYATLDRIIGIDKARHDYKVAWRGTDFDAELYGKLPQYPLNLAKAIEYAWQNRPELLQYRYESQAQAEVHKSTRSLYYPALYAAANYEKTEADKYEALFSKEVWDAGIYMNWNLFAGGSDRAKVQEQKLLTLKSDAAVLQKELLIKEEVTQAYIVLNKTKEDVRLSQSLLELSKQKFEQVSKQYEHGLSDYIELQEARQGYIDAKSGLVVSYFNYFGAIASLDAALGR